MPVSSCTRRLRVRAAPRNSFRAYTTGTMGVPVVDKAFVEDFADGIRAGQGEGILIDVRERNELPYGMIPGAVNIPLSEFVQALEKDTQFWEKQYGIPKVEVDDNVVVYCKSGMRSHQAAAYAAAKGYPNWANYAGSYIDWFGRAY